MSDRLVAELAAAVGESHVLVDADLRSSYEEDWTGRFRGDALAVVRPGSTEEVAAVVRACGGAGAAIVPQGGNTGMVGGGVPRGGEVVLSLARLDELEPVDETAAQVTAGAGVTLAALQAHAASAGLDFAVDFAARDSATLGGMAATNAGGVHVIRYGAMRAQVAGVEAVLGDGTVLTRLSGTVKDNAGYDLPGLLVGSEGTLGVITRLRLRLVPRLPARVVALFAVDGVGQALELFTGLRAALPSLNAAELMLRDGLELVCAVRSLPDPFNAAHPAYVLVECADLVDPAPALAEAVEELAGVRDVAVAEDSGRREALWAYREGHTEAVGARGVPHKLDVSLPLPRLAEFCTEVRARVAGVAPGAQTVLFGHLGDGNLHVNLLGLDPEDETADDAVLRLVAELGGSVSAEHGIGAAKVRWLGLTRSEAEIEAMRRIKASLDPDAVLNPGVLLGGPTT